MQYSNALYNCRKLFELLVLSGALAELTWPAILNKRAMFRYLSAFPYVPSHSWTLMLYLVTLVIFNMPHREVFMDFDPILVSKLSEKKIIAPGSPSSSLLSEQKLRGVIENARQILKVSTLRSWIICRLDTVCVKEWWCGRAWNTITRVFTFLKFWCPSENSTFFIYLLVFLHFVRTPTDKCHICLLVKVFLR